MKVKPVIRYDKPNYPDQKYVESDSSILNYKPDRWLRRAGLGIALSSLIMLMNTACSQKLQDSDIEKAEKHVTVPIFEHGNGRGGFGCVSVAPPAFLSEEEALQVIQEEAEKQGINFKDPNKEINSLKIPVTGLDLQYDEQGNLKKPLRTRNGILKLDGFDNEKAVAFEFVSKDDVKAWSRNEVNSTYESYDMLNTAKTLDKSLSTEKNSMTIGVFYDPVSYFTKKGFSVEADKIMKNNQEKWDDMEKQFKEMSIKDLRLQVSDFLKWLKAEGII